ncbi:MAG: 4Fe-4S dicluster domain-containing protein [Bacillota bacterium]
MLIDKTQWWDSIKALDNEFTVFVSSRKPEDKNAFLVKLDPHRETALSPFRPVDPIKLLFYPPREQVLPFSTNGRKMIVVGVKNCDLAALAVLDRAMLEEPGFEDPAYKSLRESAYLIGSDCTDILSTCHCSLLGHAPYPETGCDINISEIKAGFYLEVKTAKGGKIIDLLKERGASFAADTRQAADEVKRNRAHVEDLLQKQNGSYGGYQFHDGRDRQEIEAVWSKSSGGCVECGGCTNICPACYCVLIDDESKNPHTFRKVRTWDSCQHTGYARVAGGGAPRPKLWQRFRHRYQCKFLTTPGLFSRAGCTGCGRCIETCPAGIDIRDVMAR